MEGFRRPLSQVPFVRRDVERGTIAYWSGSIATIPLTWRLCDGTRRTPDLRDKFVPAAGVTYDPGNVGGSILHTHDFTGNGHQHIIGGGTEIGSAFDCNEQVDSASIAGTTQPKDGLPLWTSLVPIMYDGRLL